jgi:hypothetical protein
VVATELKDYEFMLLPDELTVPADKLNRLQKTAMRFVKEVEEQLDVKEWEHGELAQMARKAYKTAHSRLLTPRLIRGCSPASTSVVYGRWPHRNRCKRGRVSGTMRRRGSSKISLMA